jgi:hypothetical protein
MSKIIIELDKEEAELVLETHGQILDLLEKILAETKKNGKILRDNRPYNVSDGTIWGLYETNTKA